MPLMEDLYAKERARVVSLLPFFYSSSFQNNIVAAAATVTQTINIQSDSHFVARYFTVTCYNSAPFLVVTVPPPLLIQFFDTGSGRTLFDNSQALQNVTGGVSSIAGSLPFILPEPWLIRAGGSVQVTLQNLGVITFPRVEVSMPGIKVFRFGATVPGDVS